MVVLLSAVFWSLAVFAVVFDAPVRAFHDAVMPVKTNIASEYRPMEQFCKWAMLLAASIAVMAYRTTDKPARARFSIVVMLLALLVYFAESNFVNSAAQALIGGVLFLFIGLSMWGVSRTAAWLLAASFTLLFASIVGDVWHDHPEVFPEIAALQWAAGWAYLLEERLDLFGLFALCYAVIWCNWRMIEPLLARQPKAVALLVAALAVIAHSNGYAHFQYNPIPAHLACATVAALLGLAGFARVNERVLQPTGQIVAFRNRWVYYTVLVVLFAVVPAIYRDMPTWLNLLVLAPLTVATAVVMFFDHPTLRSGVSRDTESPMPIAPVPAEAPAESA